MLVATTNYAQAPPVERRYRVRDGAHNWVYWCTGLVLALGYWGRFFGQ